MTQRERLAKVFHTIDNECLGLDDPEYIGGCWKSHGHLKVAEALIARGVRVIPPDILEEVTINRCATPEAAAGCEPCQQGAMALVAFLNEEDER